MAPPEITGKKIAATDYDELVPDPQTAREFQSVDAPRAPGAPKPFAPLLRHCCSPARGGMRSPA
jgi:hypothetical protein